MLQALKHLNLCVTSGNLIVNSWDLVVLCLIFAWLFYKWNKNQLPVKVALLYFSNIKTALYRFGFEGSFGDVTEKINWIDSLYYLKDINAASCLTNRTNLKFKKDDSLSFNRFYVGDGESGNRYQIAFSTMLANGKNHGELSLSVQNYEKEKELGIIGAYLTEYYAPIDYFNSTNLSTMLECMFWDIREYEKTSKINRKLYVYGAKLTSEESSLQGRGLPLIYPDGSATSEKSKKGAYKIMSKGYSNSIVTAS